MNAEVSVGGSESRAGNEIFRNPAAFQSAKFRTGSDGQPLSDAAAMADVINQWYERSETGQALGGNNSMAIAHGVNIGKDLDIRRKSADAAYNKFANDPNACSGVTPIS